MKMAFSEKNFINLSPKCVAILFCFMLVITNVSMIDGKICSDIDVRNAPIQLEHKLRNCTTIIGSLSIVLIEKYNHTDFVKYTFPELREITGYLLFFRVFGIKSFRNLFPNLTVIRGERLISHYALIIYDMPALTEIGLTSLIKIQRGYVMIRYCQMLCYVHTINWEAITQVRVGNGLGNYLGFDSFNACPLTCPDKCTTNYCWNYKNCQKFETDKSSILPNVTCHEECIDCYNETANGCKACKHFQIMKNGTCVAECPKNLFAFSSFCIDYDYCIKLKKKPILGECRNSCPLIISERIVDISSIEQCARECPATEIDSLATSDLLRGCQIVKGDIYIRLQSGTANTMEILEKNLGDIEEIEGILKVHRSPVITSLSFFKNLRIIRGEKSENGKYTFILMSNENLQELWNFNVKKSLELSRGNLLVHFNSKLCLKQIRELQTVLKTNTSADYISKESNGYEQTCSAKLLGAQARVVSSTEVEILWQKINVSQSEKVIGYEVSYIVSPFENITRIGIDTCVGYGWETHFVLNITDDPKTSVHTTRLRNLTPYTQYAYYVKTQVVPKEHEEEVLGVNQGLSSILYFKTSAEAPTFPIVETDRKTNTSITLKWQPMYDNELIEFFKCDMFIQPDERKVLDVRDYCQNPRVDLHVSVGKEVSPSTVYKSCNDEFEDWKIRNPDSVDPEYEWQIHRKAKCSQRHSRQVREENQSQIMKFVQSHEINGCGNDKSCYDKNRVPRHSRSPDDGLTKNSPNLGIRHLQTIKFERETFNATFDQLLPYTLYIFQFFACNKISCSSYYFHYDRTESSIYADSIPMLGVSLDQFDSNMVHLDFSEPPTPNGLTVAFEIEMHDVTTNNLTNVCVTRKQHYENGQRYTFQHLNKGVFIFRVRSISLAHNGPYTDYQFVNVFNKKNTTGFIKTVFVCAAFFLLILFMIIFYIRKQTKRRVRNLHSSRQNILMEMEDFDRPIAQPDEIPSFFFQERGGDNNLEVF